MDKRIVIQVVMQSYSTRLRLCSHYTGYLLRRHKNHTG